MDNYLQIFLAVTGGGGIGFFLNYLISKRQTDQSEFEILLKVWKEERDDLKIERKELLEREKINSTEILELKEELSKLKSKMVLLESAHFDLPLAQCVKDLDGTIILINNEFDKIFLAPYGQTSNSCVGTNGSHIWGVENTKKYRKSELEVVSEKTAKHFIEDGVDSEGKPTKWSTFRYPIFLGEKIIATGLLALNRLVIPIKE
jgi:CRISPR/Cas system-associated protein Csx1|tara:strand:- start:3774 stop:4385 length:612 start_codon:yes stop_codon:yes gene_type:complete